MKFYRKKHKKFEITFSICLQFLWHNNINIDKFNLIKKKTIKEILINNYWFNYSIDFEGDPSATKPGNLANSAVLKMLEEEERQKDGKRSGGMLLFLCFIFLFSL